jgi:signal transduction histidine kinase
VYRSVVSETRHLNWLVLAFGIAAAGFVTSALVTHHAVSAIDDEVVDLRTNALPSVTYLSNARAELQRSRLAADRFTLAPGGTSGAGLVEVRSLQTSVMANLALEERTPWYPRERELFDQRLRPSMTRLEEATALLERGTGAADRVAADLRYDEAASDADEAMAELLDLNHAGAYSAVEDILDARRVYDRLSTVLTVAAAILCALAAAAALRLARRTTGALSDRLGVEASRAAEFQTFAERVGHDMLSPLSAVTFSLSAIERSDKNPATHRAVERATRAVLRSRAIVQGVFDFARAGARPSAGARAPLREGVRVAVEELTEGAAEGEFDVTVEDFEDRDVACDPAVLAIILRNLLGNAAKYSRGEGVHPIWIRAAAAEKTVRVEVQDAGPGVPPGLDKAIFEPYVRAPSAGQAGLGLGLATVKKMVEAHGGSLGLRRPEEGGAAFWFEMPCAPRRAKDVEDEGRDPGDLLH